MKDNLDAALAFVLEYEGGYSDLAADPGGATNLGITIAELAKWRGRSVSKDEVRALTKDEATEIYRANYWAPCHCDDLPAGVDLAVFDCAVNQGLGRASRFIQQAAGVTADGHIGPMTLAAIGAAPSTKLLTEFMARRMQGYGSLTRLFGTFGLGWSRRLIACHAEALKLAAASQPQKEAA
jgi:lysozyme family protein